MDRVFIWTAITLQGESGYGSTTGSSKKAIWRQLHHQGYYQISMDLVPRDQLNTTLSNADLIYILESLSSILDAGISIIEALELLINDRKSVVVQYVFLRLKKALHEGHSLEQAFSMLSPLFSEFFVAMIRLCEQSGSLRQGLLDLKSYYRHQEKHRQELIRILRYPKIVFGMILLMSLGVIIFVVPMFSNVYALFKGDLPILTKIIVKVSHFIHHHDMEVLASCIFLISWGYLPGLRFSNPVIYLSQKLKRILQSREDPFLYAHAMALLLESGQSISQATRQATVCMSKKSHIHGHLLTRKLNAGFSFSEAFQSLPWFPDAFQRFIAPAEQTGLLKIGFEQIYTYIDRQRAARFEKWSKFIEPALMLILGAVTLTLLLSVYLPIFDLGNRLG